MSSTGFTGNETYHFGLNESFKKFAAQKRRNSFSDFSADRSRRIRGLHCCEKINIRVNMSARFHHLQMKWSIHTLRNYYFKRLELSRKRSYLEGKPIPVEVRFALTWVLGRDVLTATDDEVHDLLYRAFLLDDIDGLYSCKDVAPFCIGDFLQVTYFGMPLINGPPPSEVEAEQLGHPKSLFTEADREAFHRIHFRR